MKEKRKSKKILSLDEEQRLLDWVYHNRSFRDYVVILTILRTGLRTTELRELRLSDISAGGEIFTHLQVRMEIARCEERSNLKEREIPIPDDLIEQLKLYLNWKQEQGEQINQMSFLFASAKSPKITLRHLQRIVRESTVSALGEPYRIYDLRRAFEERRLREPIRKDTETTFPDLAKQELKSRNNTDVTTGKTEIIQIRKGVWRTYDVTDGLPGGPYCLLQDRQGYLWLGTNAGICRYDGAEFITYTTADGLPDNWVKALCEDNQGRLWIGTGRWFQTEGRGVSCFDGKRFKTYTIADGLADNRVNALCADSQERLWIGTENGLSCFDGQGFTTYTTADGLAHNGINSICEDSQRRLWIGTAGGLSCFDGQYFTTYTTADGLAGAQVSSICEDSRGQLWIGYPGKGVSCFDGKHFKTYTSDDGLVDRQNLVNTICKDHHGRLWFGQWWGVSCFDGSRFINYTAADGMWADGVFDIIEDREGHLWFAHGELGGLSCFDAETVWFLTNHPVEWTAIQDKDGHLWFGRLSGVRLESDSSEAQQRRLPFDTAVLNLITDSNDRLWVGTYSDGLYCYDSSDAAWAAAGGEIPPNPRHFRIADGLGENTVNALLEAKDGTIWVGVGYKGRLSRFDPKRRAVKKLKFLESIEGTPQKPVHRLLEDSQGRLWLGGWHGGGLSCWDGNRLTTYTQKHGLPSDNISSLVEDDAGRIWIGTTHGLCCFDGERFITYGEEHGLRDLHHWWAVKDALGQLWFASRGGVYRTDGKHFQWLAEADGLPNNNVTGLLPQSDGTMIICTARGIVRYRPTAMVPPGMEIREVMADRVYRDPTALELTTTDADLLTISYHGLSLATRRMRYSYILEGYDEEWQETWENQVHYEKLPIGEYTFKVRAINRDLVASTAPATLRLKIVPDPRDVVISALQTQVNHLRREVGGKYHFENIIGRSATIKQVHALMEKAIDSGLNVLITGETGTGKELVAKAIHYNSPRKDKLLLARNCGAFPKDLIASELFGHRKGAFTGAYEDKEGLFEAASGGTVILDEIGEMPADAQIHLLRVLQEHKVQRLGEFQSRDVDVRVIAISNRDLESDVETGRFRQDLYHRLNVFRIDVPPLRKRLDDIPLLAEHFLQEACRQQDKEVDVFAPDVIDMLMSYPWPGNIRELENEINGAVALVEEGLRIETHHFSSPLSRGESVIQEVIAEGSGYSEAVASFQRRFIEQVLKECNGNRHEAARRLKIDRANLRRVMKRLGIS